MPPGVLAQRSAAHGGRRRREKLLKRIHDDPSISYHEVQLDPFHTDKGDWRPVFAILKHWHLDKARRVVWNATTIKVYGVELEEADFLIFEQGFSEAQREAERLDREYPPGDRVK